MKNKKQSSRRDFLTKLSLGTAALTVPNILSANSKYTVKKLIEPKEANRSYAANDQIRLATIGFGIQGIGDTSNAVLVDGIEFVAACDLYEGRLTRAKELYGKDIFTTRDYREILSKQDIDAVIIATPDHWHEKIAIDAMKAGKAVYLEKPMIKNIDEGHNIIRIEKETNSVLQVGSQGMSGIYSAKARELYKSGIIGDLVMVEIFNDRYSAEGAWQYPIPPDASPETIDYDTFLGSAPKTEFDPIRFFRWRNYQDYGTGVAGDLFVHSFSTLNFVIDSLGPKSAKSTGGLRYWKDGRDVPDIMMSLYDFPKTDNHPEFNAVLRINFIASNGGGGGFRLIGTEGAMTVGWSGVSVIHSQMGWRPTGYALRAYPEDIQKEIKKVYETQYEKKRGKMLTPQETVFEAAPDYKGADYDHFYNFFEAMRGNRKIVENATYGLRAAGAALLSNISYFEDRKVNWDPVKMQLV
jgi:predicted dehydrogenase